MAIVTTEAQSNEKQRHNPPRKAISVNEIENESGSISSCSTFAWAFSVGVVSEINLCPSHDEDALL